MSFCRNCGKQLADGAVFCTGCGTRVSAAPAPVAAAAPAQPVYTAPVQQTYAAPAQPVYAAPVQQTYAAPAQPVAHLKTNRSMIVTLLLTFVTFGIYGIIYYSCISDDVNRICRRYDGKTTMHYCLLVFLINPLTFGIASLVWFNNMSGRVGAELRRRGLNVSFGSGDFWLWYFLGSMIIVGPFIYLHKEAKALNALCAHYNQYG